jgi:hypothetical protein
MRKQLNGSRWHGKFSLELIDVDSAATELFSYQARIPVLETPQGKCLSEYFLDEDALLSYLDGG